ncbi:MAG: PAS domain S-box protein [Syntrophobacteria bacterium]
MKNEDKTNKQLISELEALHQQVAELEKSETVRRRAEGKLRESEERFRLSFENANIGMCLVGLDGRLTMVNSQMSEMFGYGRGELESMTVNDIAHPEDLDVSPKFIQRASSGEIDHIQFEKRYFHKQGHIVWAQVSSSLVRDAQGTPSYFISHVQDITERKRTEEALRKQAHDLGERVKELNCLFGISKLRERQDLSWGELFLGIVNLIPPAWQYPESTCARAILEGEEFRTENFRETIWRQTSLITVHGERIGTVEVFYLEERPEADEGPFLQEERNLLNAIAERLGRVLERKRADEDLHDAYHHLEMQVKLRTAELAKTNEELRNEIAERKRMEEALRNSSEKLKSFAYSVIHDLKSPSIGIYGLTESLHKHYRDILDEKGRSYCDQILKASVHIAALIEKITVYIESKESPLKIEETNTKEIFQIIRDEFSPRLTIRQIEWFEPETMVNIKADRLSMLRVFRNFVDNALKYGGDALSEIRIGYEESGEFHTFSVTDDGAGISGGDYEKIFGLFRRDETSKAIEGAGLGLAIVRELAERHRGRVWAEPGRQKGTTFYISVSKNL